MSTDPNEQCRYCGKPLLGNERCTCGQTQMDRRLALAQERDEYLADRRGETFSPRQLADHDRQVRAQTLKDVERANAIYLAMMKAVAQDLAYYSEYGTDDEQDVMRSMQRNIDHARARAEQEGT